ncbi:DUF2061 domain-containing protein [Pusillimonas sp. CC-YST705]|uniref:DUF2061 domain-containing protein n=1 Tax=Mesopusillimonas faecipullorum TaxID=2755040 RepID=A0ABS8C814_9BURK|nr:DUF2061 domain-containing protein [Mesopusillimonas faecipullorum]MCB5362172.1 DUF2061 domain-containing protein [Mesopusillimonas faecipullorum]
MKFIAFKTSQVCLHMGVAFAVTYTFTGSLAVGGVAAVVEPLCNVTLMPLHDKLWAKHGANAATAAPEQTPKAASGGLLSRVQAWVAKVLGNSSNGPAPAYAQVAASGREQAALGA